MATSKRLASQGGILDSLLDLHFSEPLELCVRLWPVCPPLFCSPGTLAEVTQLGSYRFGVPLLGDSADTQVASCMANGSTTEGLWSQEGKWLS